MSEINTDEAPRTGNPYQPPAVAADANRFAERSTLPVSPVWALLISLSPLPLSLGAAAIFARDEEVFICLGLAFTVLSLDGAAFVSRTLWIGPGRRSLRIAAAALVTVTIALSPAGLVHFVGRELEDFSPVGFAVHRFLNTCLCIGLAAIVFACGSRDRLRPRVRRLPRSYDIAAVAFAAPLTLLAVAFVFLERSLYSAEKFAAYAQGFDAANYGPLITTVATFLMTMVWRVLIRGTSPWKSWTMIGCGAIASLWTLSGIVLSFAVWLDGEGALGVAVAFSLVVVPAGREFFLRFAGYRAINVYAEKRRRKEALAAETAENAATNGG